MRTKEKETVKREVLDKFDKTSDKYGKLATKLEVANEVFERGAEEDDTFSGNPVKAMHKKIFQYFKELTNEEEQVRINAAFQLVLQFSKTKDPVRCQQEVSYTLKRLIRGCGASTNASRAGFFTGFVAFLKSFDVDKVPMSHIFEAVKRELHVGATIANKEDANAIVGRILACGAVLHSGRFVDANMEHLEYMTNILLYATRHRTYHSSLAYSFLIEIIETLTQDRLESCVWPLLRKELIKPWPKQTLQTVHCLMVLHKNSPQIINSKFLKTHFGGSELLNAESFQHLHRIFWTHSNTNILTHPVFALFGAYIANNAKLTEFWTEYVDPSLEKSTKLTEVVTLIIFTDILNNLFAEKTNVVNLLSDNFMRMLVEGLKNRKIISDETFKVFYDEFIEALITCCSQLKQDAQTVAVITRLLFPPGAFNIEKYTKTRIIHQLINCLGEQGVREVFKMYKNIFLANIAKNPQNIQENWLNFERLNAGYMLQNLLAHKAVQTSYAWREKQLCFLLKHGLLHLSEKDNICKNESVCVFTKTFGDQCKNMFFTSLQSKLNDLKEERKLLLSLVNYCDEHIQRKHAGKFFRAKHFDETIQKSWQNVIATAKVDKRHMNFHQKWAVEMYATKDTENLQLIFHILLLHMGLQLFHEPEMAVSAIDDLLKCMQRTREQKAIKKPKELSEVETKDDEPNWIEVVVDLFLHLLSHNSSALRNVVNALFPHLCDSLTLSSVHQILSVLNMKDGHNPLTAKGEIENDDEQEEDEAEHDQQGFGEVKNRQTNAYDSRLNTKSNADCKDDESDENDDEIDEDDDEEEYDDEDTDDNDEENAEDDKGTVSDKLRNAVSQALIGSSGALDSDVDMASVDLNDISEEEGRRLDEALTSAFKAIRKTAENSAKSKKSKGFRINTTTVLHFRIRVLDLIEIYLSQNPKLLIAIEIMIALFDMLEFCVGEELKQLLQKVEKVLNNLTSFKTYELDEDLTQQNIVNFIRLVAEKKTSVVLFDSINNLRNRCLTFLVGYSAKLSAEDNNTKVLSLWKEYQQEFVQSRNPVVNITLLSDIYKLRWTGVWDLALLLTEQSILQPIRIFRRIQIYEILSVLYKNYELHKFDEKTTKIKFKQIEKLIETHIQALAHANGTSKRSPKEFQLLLELLLHVLHTNTRLKRQSCLASSVVHNAIQVLRRQVHLDSAKVYQRYCGAFGLKVIRNSEVHQHDAIQIENNSVGTEADVENIGLNNKAEKEFSFPQKRKHSSQDSRKQKKLKKLQRFLVVSSGFNRSFDFV